MDNKLNLEAPWAETRELLKEVNLELSDDDLQYDADNAEALLQRLAAKMDRTPAQIKVWIESVSFNRGKAG